MEPADGGTAVMRRGSYDDAAASLRPQQHFKHLAQRRRSAPSLLLGKALGMPWSPIREESWCRVSVDQSPFVLGLSADHGELLLDDSVQVTEGSKTRDAHLFLFGDVIVFAKLKSPSSYRLKHRVNLRDVWIYGFEDESEDEDVSMAAGDVDLRVTVVLAWALTVCLVCFRSPEVKGRWLDTLHRKIKETRWSVGGAPPPPDVLMKVLSGSVTTKSLTGGGMEQFIDFPLEGDAKTPAPSNQQEDKPTLPTDKKWNQVVMRKLKKGSSFIGRAGRGEADAKTQLFGRALSKICPDGCSLPKPVTEVLVQLRKRGPSTEGVFRKACNSKNMKDVREQLNGGLEVNLSALPVGLLVGLLKSFLKELPGSLLVSELYSTWMAALDQEDAQRRALEIKKVVDEKLPAHNKLLLQHLVCVLHHILESADINKMDAHNLAVCIAPSMMQLDVRAPPEEQKEKTKKLTELTEILITQNELLGENIPNLLDTDEDSVSSQHHDSAYDSTDPDGDGEAGESSTRGGSSSSSLSPSIGGTSWGSNAAFNPKPPIHRRCSEPIILTGPDLAGLCGHARSHEDCSAERRDFEEQPLKKPISDDSFLLRDGGGSLLIFPKLRGKEPLPSLAGSSLKNCSCSSLESAASNQSDGSVFTSSPAVSPACPRRANGQALPDIPRPITDEKRHSQSMRVASKVLLRTRSLGAFGRNSLKKEAPKENAFPCETLQEDSQSEAEPPAERRPRPLSAIEVFKHVDSRLPCRPPTYRQAVQNIALPPQYGAMTVQDAMERRSRPSSVSYDFPPTCPAAPLADLLAQESGIVSVVVSGVSGVELRQPFRQRAMSESVSRGHHEVVSRRCSQPVFEELSYTKESYV